PSGQSVAGAGASLIAADVGALEVMSTALAQWMEMPVACWCAPSHLEVQILTHRVRHRTPRCAAREQAAAEERPLERAIAVHAAAAETRDLPDRVEARDDGAARVEDARIEIGLQPAERLARENIEADRDERAMRGV